MRKLDVLKSLVALAIIAFVACDSSPQIKEIPTQNIEKKEQPKTDVEILAENAITVDMKIEGMTCAMGCAAKIETEVASLVGVGFSRVDFDTETARFIFDKDEISSEELVAFIGEINDGAYTATIAEGLIEEPKNEEIEVEIDSTSKSIRASLQEERMTVVRKGIPSINFPKLFTYFLNSLR